jgi:hypothetical protein
MMPILLFETERHQTAVEMETIHGVPLSAGYLHFHPLRDRNMPQAIYDCRYYGAKYISSQNLWNAGGDHPSCLKGKLVGTFPSPYIIGKPMQIFEIANPLPVAYLAPDYTVIDDIKKLRPLIDSPGFDPEKAPIIDNEKEALGVGIRHGAAGAPADAVQLTRPASNRVLLKTFSAAPRILVLLDTYFDGWIATLDGKNVRIMRAFGGFKAVAMPPGGHTVEMVYRPAVLLKCLPVSALAWLIIFAGIVFTRKKRHGNGL